MQCVADRDLTILKAKPSAAGGSRRIESRKTMNSQLREGQHGVQAQLSCQPVIIIKFPIDNKLHKKDSSYKL